MECLGATLVAPPRLQKALPPPQHRLAQYGIGKACLLGKGAAPHHRAGKVNAFQVVPREVETAENCTAERVDLGCIQPRHLAVLAPVSAAAELGVMAGAPGAVLVKVELADTVRVVEAVCRLSALPP